ncbi:MAG: hypothetical protein NWR83_09050 [Salibacteraceae bacterium]|nr:hypothetical protein [Salibacteraceae bacterium]MDP4763082.1 hypothetical protein [Salibacteraceae bacterium]MDP4844598.1 hypothetical protein [Salibacteraceae bacterium]
MSLNPLKQSAKLFSFLLLSLFLIISCTSSKTEQKSIDIIVSSEGPYFAGGNSFTLDYQPDLKKLIVDKELRSEDIVSIKLSSARLSIPNDVDISFSNFTSASLQVLSDNAPMTSVAILNPISPNASQAIEMVVSDEADMAPFFKENSFTYLLDLDFKEDDYSDALKMNLTLNLTIEYK